MPTFAIDDMTELDPIAAPTMFPGEFVDDGFSVGLPRRHRPGDFCFAGQGAGVSGCQGATPCGAQCDVELPAGKPPAGVAE
jgi:hypothetical protein